MRRAPGLLILLSFVGGCEEQHGFLKVGANVLFNDTDTFECGEAKIAPKAGGLLDAFLTLKPQECLLTLHRSGDLLGFGTKICTLQVRNNRITSVYLTENRGSLACSIGGA